MSDVVFADLGDEQLKIIEALEQKLGINLIAYQSLSGSEKHGDFAIIGEDDIAEIREIESKMNVILLGYKKAEAA